MSETVVDEVVTTTTLITNDNDKEKVEQIVDSRTAINAPQSPTDGIKKELNHFPQQPLRETEINSISAARPSNEEKISDLNHHPNETPPKNETNGIPSVDKPSDDSKDNDESKQEESKPDGSGESTSLDELYKRLLKRVKLMEKKMREELDISFDESEADDTPEEEEEKEDEDEEEAGKSLKVEEPFSLKKSIKYVLSETWRLPEVRALWREPAGSHTLVVSMKSSGVNLIHPPSNPVLDDVHPTGVISKVAMEMEADENDMVNCKPDRVAIVCTTLQEEVNRITGGKITPSFCVFIPPFKMLVPFHHEFSECLQEQEAVCKKLLAEQSAMESAATEQATNRVEEGTKSEPEAEKDRQKDEEDRKLTWEKQQELNHAQKVANGMKCLLHFMETHLRDTLEIQRQIKEGTLEEIDFGHLWYLFKPGDLVVTRKPKDQAYRVLHVGGGRICRNDVDKNGNPVQSRGPKKITDFFVDCYKIDFNGIHYGPVHQAYSIAPYEGQRQIAALDVVPISSVPPDKEGRQLEDMLIARGKKFVRLARVSHKKYKGFNLREGPFRHEEVDGDVIIDFALAFKESKPPYEIEPPALGGDVFDEPRSVTTEETREVYQGCSTPGCCEVLYVYDDTEFDLRRRTEFKELPTTDLNPVSAIEGKLGKERQLILPYRVYGYVLLSRKWYPLDIDLVKDVEEPSKDTKDGFSDLVLPEDHKEIVRALVKTHTRGPRSTAQDKTETMLPNREIDLVKGKGKGLIILLHGVPGVGKTSTAECVAANTNRPLFPITCGDIGGTTAKEVETNLESYFDLARKWGCVLLLDEADVFLGERTKGDIVQNSLVSVFLRVLEYYSGILILTTNRVGQFDEAIKSRIHINLYYPPLTKKSSLEIWKMNLNRLERQDVENPDRRPILFSRKEIMNFAKEHWKDNEISKTNWNGRQIKNAFQTAIALAEWDYLDTQSNPKFKNDSGPLLEARHFKKVAEASARFDQYLKSVRNSDMFNAKAKNNRRDDFVDTGTATEGGLRYQNLQEAKRADRARRERTSEPDFYVDEDGGDSSESPSDSSDDDFKAKKKQMELLRIKKEEQQMQKEKEEKLGKRKLKEAKKTQQREEQESKKREELMRKKASDTYDSDNSDD